MHSHAPLPNTLAVPENARALCPAHTLEAGRAIQNIRALRVAAKRDIPASPDTCLNARRADIMLLRRAQENSKRVSGVNQTQMFICYFVWSMLSHHA